MNNIKKDDHIDTSDNVNTIDRNIGIWIKIHRIQKNLTQKGLADQLELSAQQVQKYEQGLSKITVNLLNKLAVILDTSVENFLQPIEKKEQTLVDRRPARTNKTLKSRQKSKNLPRVSNTEMEKKLMASFRRLRDYDIRMNMVSMLQSIADQEDW